MWNFCVKTDNEFRTSNGKGITFLELQKRIKNIVPLHSKNIQHVMRKYLTARFAMWESRKAKHENSNKVQLPYKNKKYYTSGWDYQSIKVDYDKGTIKLSKAKTTNKQPKPVICYAKTMPRNIVQIELIYRHKLYLSIKYKVDCEFKQIESANEASIDLGEIHAITSIDNNGNALIITGRKLRCDKRLRNKEQGKIYSKMRKYKINSKQYNKYKKALNSLTNKFKNKELDSIHKITKLYVDYCIEGDINTLYYGDLDSCTRGRKGKVSKKVGQKLNQWSHGLLMLQLENKLSRYNIKLIKINEAYTSRKCPSCGKLNKPKSRNYHCKYCNYTMHRDINGAINILNDNSKYHITRYNNFKYLRIS